MPRHRSLSIDPREPPGQTVEKALAANAKIVIPAGSELVNVIGELAGVLPLKSGPGPAEAVSDRR